MKRPALNEPFVPVRTAGALPEFRVFSSTYSVGYGQNVGRIFNVAIQSETNEFHGSAFEFLRNDVLNARNCFAPGKPTLRLVRGRGNSGRCASPIATSCTAGCLPRRASRMFVSRLQVSRECEPAVAHRKRRKPPSPAGAEVTKRDRATRSIVLPTPAESREHQAFPQGYEFRVGPPGDRTAPYGPCRTSSASSGARGSCGSG